jgi:acyl-CoA oxidase
VDASINQRLAKAVTEAFVAAQVSGMINNLANLPSEDAKVVGSLYGLVSCYLRYWKLFLIASLQ